MAVAPGLRVGRYEVSRKLGQGGFGILYVGRDTELDREVALKFLRPEHVTRPDVVMRFLQEARSAAKINHPGIVTVFECGQVHGTSTRADGTVYIAMELLAGESLHARLKRERLLPLSLAVSITRQMCAALQAAHLAGIVHRDLKPDNIFLVPDPAMRDGIRVKVLDFGVAKLADGQFSGGVRTHSAMVLGTPNYMSPEQCKSSAKVDHRSDIYAVGCILYELLCGKRPYEGDAGEQIAQHQLGPVPVPREVNANVPIELDRLITQMLAKSPDDRPGSMDFVDEVLAMFERAPTAPGVAMRASAIPDAESPPTAVSTMFEGEHAPTKVSEARPRRLPIIAGALGVIALGIALGIGFTRGGSASEPLPAAVPDATTALDAVKKECEKLAAARTWPELRACSDRMLAVDAAAAAGLRAQADAEEKAAEADRAGVEALVVGDLRGAKAAIDKIPNDSIYRRDALATYGIALSEAENEYATRGKALALDGKCSDMAALISEATDKGAAGKITGLHCGGEPLCDADALRQKGEDHLQTGMDAAALAAFEESMRCRPDDAVTRFAFMAACRSKNAAKANEYYPKLPPATATGLVQICVRNGIQVAGGDDGAATTPKPKAKPAACDAAALRRKGEDHLRTGMDAAALAAFEASLKCKPDEALIPMALMAACRSKNAVKANYYYQKAPPSTSTAAVQICVRNGIQLDAQPTCDADALRQKGEDHLQTGMDAAALAAFEASMRCRPDAALMRFAFMAACRSKNAAKAKAYYPKLPPATTRGIAQICDRNGIKLP